MWNEPLHEPIDLYVGKLPNQSYIACSFLCDRVWDWVHFRTGSNTGHLLPLDAMKYPSDHWDGIHIP